MWDWDRKLYGLFVLDGQAIFDSKHYRIYIPTAKVTKRFKSISKHGFFFRKFSNTKDH